MIECVNPHQNFLSCLNIVKILFKIAQWDIFNGKFRITVGYVLTFAIYLFFVANYAYTIAYYEQNYFRKFMTIQLLCASIQVFRDV